VTSKVSNVASGIISLGITVAAASAPDSTLAKMSEQGDAQQSAAYSREISIADIRSANSSTISGK